VSVARSTSKTSQIARAILAEFATPEALLEAARTLRSAGFTDLETFTPCLVEGLDEALALPRPRVIPALVLVAGLTGLVVAVLIQQWTGATDFPLDVGGRPLSSWPAYVPIAFETTVLFAALAAFGAPLLLSQMPRLWHPVFEVEGFESATIDGYWLAVAFEEADNGRCSAIVEALDPSRLVIVPIEAVR
jgi:hypothetical protein